MKLGFSEIRRGIPTPPPRWQQRGLAKALWELNPNECRDVSGHPDLHALQKAVARYNQRWPDRRFATRKEDGFVRVWRVK